MPNSDTTRPTPPKAIFSAGCCTMLVMHRITDSVSTGMAMNITNPSRIRSRSGLADFFGLAFFLTHPPTFFPEQSHDLWRREQSLWCCSSVIERPVLATKVRKFFVGYLRQTLVQRKLNEP